MRPTFELLQTVFQKGFPLLLGFTDDALLFGFSKLGFNLPWLQCLSTVLLTATALFWTFRCVRFLLKHYRRRAIATANSDQS